jgi:hypothetical protein
MSKRRRNKQTEDTSKNINIVDNPLTDSIDESRVASEEEAKSLSDIPNPFPDYENFKEDELKEFDKDKYSTYTGLPKAKVSDEEPTNINPDTNEIWRNEPPMPSTEPDKGYISPRQDDVIANLLNVIGG